MPKFKYVAIDPSGAQGQGRDRARRARCVRATSSSGRELRRRARSRSARASARSRSPPKKLKPADLMNFSRQFAAFLRAGIPILDALEMLTSDASNKRLQQMLIEISDALRSRLDASPTRWPRTRRSSPATTSASCARPSSPATSTSCSTSSPATSSATSRRHAPIKSALTYPIVILVMAIGTVVVLVAYVLPEVQGRSSRASTPSCRCRPACCSRFARLHRPVRWSSSSAPSVAFVVFLVVYLQHRAREAHARDKVLLKLPMVKDVVRYAVIERFCRILGAMLQAGVPVPEAMTAATRGDQQPRVCGGAGRRPRGDACAARASPGRSPDRPVPAAAETDAQGRGAVGHARQAARAAADYYEGELDYKLKRLTTLFEPAVIVIMGADRRVRRHRARVGDVRDLQPGQVEVGGITTQQEIDLHQVLTTVEVVRGLAREANGRTVHGQCSKHRAGPEGACCELGRKTSAATIHGEEALGAGWVHPRRALGGHRHSRHPRHDRRIRGGGCRRQGPGRG